MTEEQELRELLARHADSLVQGRDERGELLAGYGGSTDREMVEALVWLADELARIFVPVDPRPEFVQALGERLEAAPEKTTYDRRRRMAWVVAAASVSSVASVAAIYYWRRSHGRLDVDTGVHTTEFVAWRPAIDRWSRNWSSAFRGR